MLSEDILPALIDKLERWERSARPFVPTLKLYVREPRVLLERAGWRYQGHFEMTERDIPYELSADLMERMPQAKLRDLFRPVMEVGWHERESLVEPRDVAGRRALEEAKAAQRHEPPGSLASLLREVKNEQARRRAWLSEPWQPFLRDDEPRRAVVPWGGSYTDFPSDDS